MGINKVLGKPKTPSIPFIYYPIYTLSLYISRFLGLNMIEPYKPLYDSGLAVRILYVSNKAATKVYKIAPIYTGAKSK